MIDRMDALTKQKLNIFLVVDVSKSMQGKRIGEVNKAIRDIITYLKDFEKENSNVDFYLSILKFGTTLDYHFKEKILKVDDIKFEDIKARGYSNLHLAYDELTSLLEKEAKGGVMPDFGGIAPIILLLTDGHPTKYPVKAELARLEKKPWYQVATRYGIAIELHDKRTIKVLRDFVQDKGDVIECYDSNLLKKIIKVIVVTASKVKSSGTSVHQEKKVSITKNIQLEVSNALNDEDDWEW